MVRGTCHTTDGNERDNACGANDDEREVDHDEDYMMEEENNNNNNERISRALFHVKHAQLRWTGADTKIENASI